MHFNIIDEPWMSVRYLDGTVKYVSIRQCFMDSEIIQGIQAPVFRGQTIWIYDVPVMMLLTTIVLAAYYKPGNFQSATQYGLDEIQENGLNTETVHKYLDAFHHRFDLFDKTHPFLQDISLETIIDSFTDETVVMVNPLAPSNNAPVFGRIRSIGEKGTTRFFEPYKMSIHEFVYALLYQNCLGVSPMAAKYPNKSLAAASTEYVMFQGANLRDTILLNCVPLTKNARPSEEDDIPYDRPIWEFNNVSEITSWAPETLAQQTLLCSFFPSFPILGKYMENEDFVRVAISKNTDDVVLPPDVCNALRQEYIKHHPWAIKTVRKDETTVDYATYTSKSTAIGICIAATNTLASKDDGCILLNGTETRILAHPSRLYYRGMDKYKCNIEMMGYLSVPQHVFDVLTQDMQHRQAVKYEEYAKSISQMLHRAYKKAGFVSSSEKMGVVYESNYSKTKLTDFSLYIEHNFFYEFLQDMTDEKNREDALKNNILKLCTQAERQFSEAMDACINVKAYAQAMKNLHFSLMLIKKKGGFINESS